MTVALRFFFPDTQDLTIRRIYLKASKNITFTLTTKLQFGREIVELDIRPNDFLIRVDKTGVTKKGTLL